MKDLRQPRVTQSALIKRINRKLAKKWRFGEVLRKSRGARANFELGDYYVVDIETDGLVARDVDLDELGRNLKVLRDGELLADQRDDRR